ncbi:MAG: FAD-dependent oxidoreductase [Desulfobacteraceae bacterium]|nr:FAD-dependent oxidoreductase [Desulfobacteraceae bacterium]
MTGEQYCIIHGEKDGRRLSSRILEEQIQQAVDDGRRHLVVKGLGQHGIGGRLWKTGDEPIRIQVDGQAGQRVGSMGYPNTHIEVMGPVSDDLGWLNAGATIVVHGNAGNGVANAMAQGRVYVGGNIGARGMTMTKQNPRFAPPQLWVLGSAGDYFGEFMAGGMAVVCGIDGQNPGNVLGYRPLVGMVGGKVFFRGPHDGYSRTDAQLIPISDADWEWFHSGLTDFLTAIGRMELRKELSEREQWQLIRARNPQDRIALEKSSMAAFKETVWDKILGKGGIVGDLTDLDRTAVPLITRGELRRYIPVWEQGKYLAPCEATCPTGIPVQRRWQLIREGRIDEAVDLALAYTPFPATICGYLCPNLCMQSCTRQSAFLAPVDVKQLGKASIDAKTPELPGLSGKKVAVVGGGPAGLSTAWQLRLNGHEAIVFDTAPGLGGKIASAVPKTRIPDPVFNAEIERVKAVLPQVHLQQDISRADLDRLITDHDAVVVAVGAQKPRTIPIPGKEKMIPALDFLLSTKQNKAAPGARVVIIGAGNVGCDAASEAHRLGATEITLLDVQEPASFGAEREHAEAVGARFRWPVSATEISDGGVILETGEVIPADTVIISIGDAPDLDFLPDGVVLSHGFVQVDENFYTGHENLYAIGDAVKPGLLTDAVGAGRKAADAISRRLSGEEMLQGRIEAIDVDRVKLEYFDPRIIDFEDADHCGSQCASCGNCRDCGICAAICPETAIRRVDKPGDDYAYEVDENRCIGCGFCAGACPCGVWNLVQNTPMG